MPSYRDAGVDRDAARETVERIKRRSAGAGRSAADSPTPGASLLDIGGFAAAVAPPKMEDPVILSATDGVGTKLEVALQYHAWETIGIDVVAMCVNDLICHGADPLFFLDYLACGKLEPEVAEGIVGGVAEGCRQAHCSLVGGETAEMPGFYQNGRYDIAGFAVGMAERRDLLDGSKVRAGDVLIGLPSTGVHSNGFSLVRHVVEDYEEALPDAVTVAEALLEPTRIYVDDIRRLREVVEIHGIAHITGGGLEENLPRMWAAAAAASHGDTPSPLAARIQKADLPDLPVFRYLAGRGIEEAEMFATFNMGVGMVVAVALEDAERALAVLGAGRGAGTGSDAAASAKGPSPASGLASALPRIIGRMEPAGEDDSERVWLI